MVSDARHRPGRPALLRHLHTDGFLGDLPLVNFAYAPYFERGAAQVPLPHPQRLHVALLQARIASPNGAAGAVQVHRQRRQLRRQPDHAHDARRAGHRRALRHRRRLLDSSRSADRLKLVNLLESATTGAGRRTPVAWRGAGGRSDDDPVVGPIMEFRIVGSVPSVDGRAHADHGQQLRHQRQEPGARPV